MKEIPQTYDSISKKFLSMITQFQANRIDIILNQYFTPSIKDCEHALREELSTPVSIGPNQIRPHNFAAQLRNINFKKSIVNFSIKHWSSDDMASFIGNKTIYLSFSECYCYRIDNNKVIMTKDDSLSCEAHEEADSRIVFHICQIDFDAEVIIRCSDSDILIILLANMDNLNASLKLWMNIGVGNHQRYINVIDLFNVLGKNVCKALPGFHAMTGCDYTPAFFRKGKLRPFKLLKESEEYQLAFQNLLVDDKILEKTFTTLEKFVCQMYGVRNSSDVNLARFQLFSTAYQSKKVDDNFQKTLKNFDPSSLPPCKTELRQHLLRVRYVTQLRSNAYLKYPTSLSPETCGWSINDDKYELVWFLGDQLPSSVADIILQGKYLLNENNIFLTNS